MLTQPVDAALAELVQRFSEARSVTDRVFATVKQSSLYERPIPERHRVIFYIGHLESFDWNLLRERFQLKPFNPEFDQLFAFGIDPLGGSTPNDQAGDWPSLHQVERYRVRIREELDAALAGAAETEQLVQLLNIAIEHRLMHAETLEYMLHQLPYQAKVRADSDAAKSPKSQAVPRAVRVPAGTVTLGLKPDAGERGSRAVLGSLTTAIAEPPRSALPAFTENFGWDNEFAAHEVEVPAFSIDKYKVTNGQFLKFVEAGGYNNPALWSSEDWDWKTREAVSHPVFWVAQNDGFRYRSMFEEIALPSESPVYVSYAEANAFARWAGKALPAEAEWQRAAEGAKASGGARTLWDPPPIGAEAASASRFGVEGLIGTGWEWTASEFAPFVGFKAHPAYPGYSANFFDGKHYVLKGGSPRTAACMLRKSFRNWFQPHYQYVYAGFRCVTR